MAEGKRAIAGRLGLEFLIVVVGILTALGVDDWSQARSDRQLEVHLLTSLAADLENDRQDAERQERYSARHRDAVDHLLAISGHPSAPGDRQFGMSSGEIDASLHRLSSKPELEVFNPTFTEMIATGSIRVIRNQSLRRQIASYYQRAELLLSVPLREIDPRPDLQSALAALGVVPGEAGTMPDLSERLRSDPMIATHALRIRQYYENRVALDGLEEVREALTESVHRERGTLPE